MNFDDLVLGIDGGGTKTVAWLCKVDRAALDPLGRGAAGPSASGTWTVPLSPLWSRSLLRSRGCSPPRGEEPASKIMSAFDKDEQDYLSGAFHHITRLLLRQQITDFKSGKKVGNHVHPDALSEREKDILVDSLKAIDSLRKRVSHEFAGELF